MTFMTSLPQQSDSHIVEPIGDPVTPAPKVSVSERRADASDGERRARRFAAYAVGAAALSFAVLTALAAAVLAAGAALGVAWFVADDTPTFACGEGSIAVIPLVGSISSDRIGVDAEGYSYTSSAYFIETLEAAVESDEVEGIVLDINSPGGEVVPSLEIAAAIERAAESKPVASYVRSVGASGAYFAAIAADRSFVHTASDVGSIGAILSYLDEVERNEQEGYGYVEFTSAPYKSAGSPYRDLTQRERDMFQGQVDDVHGMIVDFVARARGVDVARAEVWADGSTWLGLRAVEQGIVDEVGEIDDAISYVANRAGIETYSVCELPPERDTIYF